MSELAKKLEHEFLDKEYADAYVEDFENTAIATQIKVLREQRGWSQQQLAERAGMKQERIAVIEDVDYSSWSIKTLRRIAKAFDLVLKVSFESFGTVVDDIERFDRKRLERRSRIASLRYRQLVQARKEQRLSVIDIRSAVEVAHAYIPHQSEEHRRNPFLVTGRIGSSATASNLYQESSQHQRNPSYTLERAQISGTNAV